MPAHQAIEALRRVASNPDTEGYVRDRLSNIENMIRRAHKFYFAGTDSLRNVTEMGFDHIWRPMPFPTVYYELDVSGRKSGTLYSEYDYEGAKRALCLGFTDVTAEQTAKGFPNNPELRNFAMSLCPDNGAVWVSPDDIGPTGMPWYEYNDYADFSRREDLIAVVGKNAEDLKEQAIYTGGKALTLLAFFNMLLECKNFPRQSVAAPHKLNEKRIRKSKPPIYSYHKIDLRELDGAAGSRGGLSGDRRGPRLHHRRGHIRHMRSGKLIWVDHCMVGLSTRGIVSGEYHKPIKDSLPKTDKPLIVR